MTTLTQRADRIQNEGTSIIIFQPTEEKRRDEKIREEVGQIRELANNYLNLKNSIDGFKSDISQNFLELRKLDASIIFQSKKEIISNALKVVCENLNAQAASIFLVSKDGILERCGLYGFDKDGQPLDNEWFSSEKYVIGESFTGKAAKSRANSNYGEIQYTSKLSEEDIKIECREKYIEKFSELRCAIAIPLNGQNRTYGVLRVINKINKINQGSSVSLSPNAFSESDTTLLLFLATNISNKLSNFRRDIQVEILKYLSRLLIQPSNLPKDRLKNVYEQAIELLVQNPETAFKAGVLRVKNRRSGFLEVKASSFASNVTKSRNDQPRDPNDNEFLWIPAIKQKRLILQDIQSILKNIQKTTQRGGFRNRDWIIENSFQSFACFPLVVKNETVGTFSLYTGYKYEFSPDTIDFLQGVADLLGSFIFNIQSEEMKNALQLPNQKKLDSDIGHNSQAGSRVERKFKELADQWRKETEHSSLILEISMHPAYQRIIGLGEEVIPLLLKELSQRKNEPEHWFWALSALTGQNPISEQHRGNLVEMGKSWLEWGEREGYEFD